MLSWRRGPCLSGFHGGRSAPRAAFFRLVDQVWQVPIGDRGDCCSRARIASVPNLNAAQKVSNRAPNASCIVAIAFGCKVYQGRVADGLSAPLQKAGRRAVGGAGFGCSGRGAVQVGKGQ